MIDFKGRSEPHKSLLIKYMKLTGLDLDTEFYRGVDRIKEDIEFYNGFISRCGSRSPFGYEVRLSLHGLIMNGFIQRINNEFNYYDYELLKEYLYVYEILKRIFANYWIGQQGIN